MNLLIIGAGQYGMVVKEIALTTGRFDKIDFLDDNNAVAIDGTNNISKWVSEYKIAIVAIGKADVSYILMSELATDVLFLLERL